MYRISHILVAALAISVCAPNAWAVKILHSQPRKMEKTAFTRLGDFFGFHPVDPTRIVVFSNPKNHTGLFFEAELDTSIGKLPEGCSAKLELITQDDRTPQEFVFKIPTTHSEAKALYLGLTDSGFSKKLDIRIFAWKISILDKNSTVLASIYSPLWQY